MIILYYCQIYFEETLHDFLNKDSFNKMAKIESYINWLKNWGSLHTLYAVQV